MAKYTVVVGNLGTTYDGNCVAEAHAAFDEHISNYGRAAAETVTLFEDGEPIEEYEPLPHPQG